MLARPRAAWFAIGAAIATLVRVVNRQRRLFLAVERAPAFERHLGFHLGCGLRELSSGMVLVELQSVARAVDDGDALRPRSFDYFVHARRHFTDALGGIG